MGSIQRYVTDRLESTKVLEIPSFWLSYAVSTVEFIRIVATKVTGSIPVGLHYCTTPETSRQTLRKIVASGDRATCSRHHVTPR